MEDLVTVFRSADSSAEEDARAMLALLAGESIQGTLFDDRAPGVPAGAWELRVAAQHSGHAEALIAAQTAWNETVDIDESHNLDLVTVFRSAGSTGEMEAMSVKSLLEANGLAAVLVGDSRFPNLPDEVRVPKEDETRAKRLIADALAAGPAGASEAEAASEE
jgi:hypothetical protein